MTERGEGRLNQERLKELLEYEPETGDFSWKVSTSNRVKVGDIAGSTSNGYRVIMIDGRLYRSHRLAWLYVYNSFPRDQIDHIDGDKSNNRIANLREATNRLNAQNVDKPHRNSKSGYLGVRKCGKKWVASLWIDGKKLHCGTHSTPEEAHASYLEVKKAHHTFARSS